MVGMKAIPFFRGPSDGVGLFNGAESTEMDVTTIGANGRSPFFPIGGASYTAIAACVGDWSCRIAHVLRVGYGPKIGLPIVFRLPIDVINALRVATVNYFPNDTMSLIPLAVDIPAKIPPHINGSKGLGVGVGFIPNQKRPSTGEKFSRSRFPKQLPSLWIVVQQGLKLFARGQGSPADAIGNSHKCSSRTFVGQAWWGRGQLPHHAVNSNQLVPVISGFCSP